MDPDKPATTSTCKPARQFKDRWLTAFPWLLFEEGKMFCTLRKESVFTAGVNTKIAPEVASIGVIPCDTCNLQCLAQKWTLLFARIGTSGNSRHSVT
eukprot:Em0015g397a